MLELSKHYFGFTNSKKKAAFFSAHSRLLSRLESIVDLFEFFRMTPLQSTNHRSDPVLAWNLRKGILRDAFGEFRLETNHFLFLDFVQHICSPKLKEFPDCPRYRFIGFHALNKFAVELAYLR